VQSLKKRQEMILIAVDEIDQLMRQKDPDVLYNVSWFFESIL
jgi:hypothetical protein